MAIDVDRLCKNCMLEIPDGQTVCPNCGYDPENAGTLSRPEHALPVLTILKGKYLAGPVLDAKESGITYLALDLVSEERVIVEEHEPDQAGMRPETGNAADGSAVTDSFEEYGRFYTIKEYEPETTDSEPDRTDSGSKSPAPKKALDGKG